MNLLEKTLMLDPEVRLTAKDALSHPYLSEFHDPENEPDSLSYDDSFESLELAVSEWKSENPCTHAYIHIDCNTYLSPTYAVILIVVVVILILQYY